jgi:hypothetical protein
MTDHARQTRAHWLRAMQHPITTAAVEAIDAAATLVTNTTRRAVAQVMLAVTRMDLRLSERLVETYRADAGIELAKQLHLRDQIKKWKALTK